MGFFSKIKSLFSRKKKVSEQISEKNEENNLVKQEKFDDGLRKSSSFIDQSINELSKKYHKVDAELLEAIEESLISFDISIHSVTKIMESIEEEIKYQKVNDVELVKQIIVDKLLVYYIQDSIVDTNVNLKEGTNVLLVSGVNGVGKTTSIAKLANFFKNQGKSVALIAADTYRAGAVEQLKKWGERLNIEVYSANTEGQDPASVVYAGLKSAVEKKIDVLLCDTSGRLSNKVNLMNELKKIHGVIKKFIPDQPLESLLVIDATSGQNGIVQAKAFNEVTQLTGIILTKMDSSSKGGVVLSIKDVLNLPIKFIGFGEGLEDMEEFDLEKYILGLLKNIDFIEK